MTHLPVTMEIDLKKITDARHHDPFSFLGRHYYGDQVAIRTYIPHATKVMIAEGEKPMQRISETDIFEWRGENGDLPEHYRLIWKDRENREHI